MHEFDLITKYLKPLATTKESLGLADDAAILQTKSKLVISTDSLVEDIHFFKGDDPRILAQKALRVNLSDMAAMGATPRFYTLNLTLPQNFDESWLKDFCRGLKSDQKKYGVSLIGGDTTSHKNSTIISITVFGEAKKPLKRSSAKVGDLIFVSGNIGDSALALRVLQKKITFLDKSFLQKYYLPEPQIELGKKLGKVANSAIDISDGLIADLSHLLKASKKSAAIFIDKIPLSQTVQKILKQNPAEFSAILSGGDDYQLLFTLPANKRKKIDKIAKILNIKISEIGKITDSQDSLLSVLDKDGKDVSLDKKGFEHF
jgi:thiamine-monophosphate kinase